ncbi:Uncharacterised protein [Metamycoplasma cloacale]|uniref:hypothetical protein n=1 Tax=Metamycoplasma cloacale TaxID=92401 RepID=UPI000494C122|nr:hypothetical protein [Metamycoplasma cloacale]VEU79180.1 Uncharacterised protein [Metamycoplasma cloacale]
MQRKDIQELFDIAWINTIDEKLTRNSDSNKRFDLSNEENRKLLSYLLKRYSIFSIFSNGGRLSSIDINDKLNFIKLDPIVLRKKENEYDSGKCALSTIKVDNPMEWENYTYLMHEVPNWYKLAEIQTFISKLHYDFYAKFIKNNEKESFKYLEENINKENKIIMDFNKATGIEIYKKLVDEATKLSLILNENEENYFIDRDEITISVDPIIFDKIATTGLLEHKIKLSSDDELYSSGYIASYKIVSNPYLCDAKVIIGTTFSCLFAIKPIQSSYCYIDNLSKDIIAYFKITCAKKIENNSSLIMIKDIND